MTPRELKIQRLEDRVELGGATGRIAARQLEDLLNEELEELSPDEQS
jgi:hypothetical protein